MQYYTSTTVNYIATTFFILLRHYAFLFLLFYITLLVLFIKYYYKFKLMEAPSQPQGDDIVILSDNESKEKNSGRPFTDIWKYIKRGKSRGNSHYEETCNFCGKKWSRGKPTSLRAHIANHCTSTNIPADIKSYFIKIVANENEKKGNILIVNLKVIRIHLKDKK